MYFNSIQEALAYVFNNKPVTIINLPNSPHPWFFVDEIRNALEYRMDNFALTKNLAFRDRVIASLNVHELRVLGSHHINDMVTSYLSTLAINRPTIMIISLPGLFELLTKSRSRKALPFQEWLYFTVLPTLYHNPDLVQQINQLSYEKDVLQKNYYDLYNDNIEMRKRQIKMEKINNKVLVSIISNLTNTNNTKEDIDTIVDNIPLYNRYKCVI